VRETQAVRHKLDPYAVILDTLVEITGDPHDGVKKSELNDCAESVATREEGWRHWGNAEKLKLGEAMVRRGATVSAAKVRFNNCPYWRGVRWSQEIIDEGRVTLPDWEAET